MQSQTRTRSHALAAIVVILAAAVLTVALIGLIGRSTEPAAQIADGTSNATGVDVTDGWMHNEVLNPQPGRDAGITDGWMHNEVLNPQPGRDAAITDGWMHNEILNPPRAARGADVTDGWMHNEILNPPELNAVTN